MADKYSISIIIPVYNEILGIEKLIKSLKPVKDKCEIIFVDGGSTDGTPEIIKKDFTLYPSPKIGRSSQMNYGVSKSHGDVLFFLHGDSVLPVNALEEIDGIISKGHKAGCFKIKFQSKSFLMFICGFMSNLRVKFRNIAFGDQGIFILKTYFEKLGGYREIPIMEDYRISMDIKKDLEKFGIANSKILTSERRFIKNGRISTMINMQKLQLLYRKGVEVDVLSKLYK